MDAQRSNTPEHQCLHRESTNQPGQSATGSTSQQMDHDVQPYRPTSSSSDGHAPIQISKTQLSSSDPTPYHSAAGIYRPSYPQQGQVFQPSPLCSSYYASGGQPASASSYPAYGSFLGSASSDSAQYVNRTLPDAAQLPPSTRSYQYPYQRQTPVPQGPSGAVAGFRFQPQLAPHLPFAHNNQPRTTYPPNAVPLVGPSVPSASAPPKAGVSSSLSSLLQSLTTPPIQRPQFAPAHRAPMLAGYPTPIIQPAPTPVDPTLIRIKYLADTFHAAATSDPAYYLLYCRFCGAQVQSAAFPDLVFYLRLHLQVGWIEFLEHNGRQNEIGDTWALLRERKDLISWLVRQSKTLKQRAGTYLISQLAKFTPLNFDPKQVSPVAKLIDHLFELETDAFYKPTPTRAPTKQEYRVKVVTFLDYEGGEAKVVQDVNVLKRSTWAEMQCTLSALTQNVQAAQLGYSYGWQANGYHGDWMFWAGDGEKPEGWNRLLMTEAGFQEMKALLQQGQKVWIEHSQQVEIRENLLLADALGLGLDRPFEFCKALPPAYRSAIIGPYPNPMGFSYLSHAATAGSRDGVTGVRRGKRSEHGRLVRRVREKKRQKAFVPRCKRA